MDAERQDSVIERCARAVCANSGPGFCRDMGEHLGCKAGRGELPHWSLCKASADQLSLSRNMDVARAVLNVPGIFIAPDRQPEDSDLGYRGRIAIAMQEWLMSLKTNAINEGDA